MSTTLINSKDMWSRVNFSFECVKTAGVLLFLCLPVSFSFLQLCIFFSESHFSVEFLQNLWPKWKTSLFHLSLENRLFQTFILCNQGSHLLPRNLDAPVWVTHENYNPLQPFSTRKAEWSLLGVVTIIQEKLQVEKIIYSGQLWRICPLIDGFFSLGALLTSN